MPNLFLAPLQIQAQMLSATMMMSTRLTVLTMRSQAQFMRAFLPKPLPTGRKGAACMPYNLRF